MYNRKHGDSFKLGSDTIIKDKDKSKLLKKLIRNKKKALKTAGSPRNHNSFLGSSKGL